MTFSQQLQIALTRSGLTQAEAAALIGISPRPFWEWLHGKVTPHPYMQAGALEALLRVPAKRPHAGRKPKTPSTP